MRYLLDTNIVLELLLNQDKAEDVISFLEQTPMEECCLTDFALYSIGLILFRQAKKNIFVDLFQDLFTNNGMNLLKIPPNNLADLVEVSDKFHLDFDDAYHYCLAKLYQLVLVSFDHDFDRTDLTRIQPGGLVS